MRVVDTSAWIEWIMDSPTADRVQADFPAPEQWVVPTIVQLELVKWLNREVGPAQADEILALTQTLIVVPLDTTIAVAAAAAAGRHRLSTADAIVYATALAQRADVLTCDAHFKGLEAVRYVPKA